MLAHGIYSSGPAATADKAGEEPRKLDLRFSPAGSDNFLLGAEPAFHFAQVD